MIFDASVMMTKTYLKQHRSEEHAYIFNAAKAQIAHSLAEKILQNNDYFSLENAKDLIIVKGSIVVLTQKELNDIIIKAAYNWHIEHS